MYAMIARDSQFAVLLFLPVNLFRVLQNPLSARFVIKEIFIIVQQKVKAWWSIIAFCAVVELRSRVFRMLAIEWELLMRAALLYLIIKFLQAARTITLYKTLLIDQNLRLLL